MKAEKPDAPFLLTGRHCSFEFHRPAWHLVLIVVRGIDVGELGRSPFQEIASDLAEGQVIDLFIDARDATSVSLDVSGDWAGWLIRHKSQIRRFCFLCGSPFVQLTAGFVRKFANLGDRMHILSDPDAFEFLLKETMRGAGRDSKVSESARPAT